MIGPLLAKVTGRHFQTLFFKETGSASNRRGQAGIPARRHQGHSDNLDFRRAGQRLNRTEEQNQNA